MQMAPPSPQSLIDYRSSCTKQNESRQSKEAEPMAPPRVTDKVYIGKHSPLKCTNSFVHFFFDHVGTNEKRICKQIRNLLRKIASFPKRNAKRGISPVATGDQRPTALDPCRLLKKSGENFLLFVSGNMFVSDLRRSLWLRLFDIFFIRRSFSKARGTRHGRGER